MSVDFYNCGGCGEIHSDCEPLHLCICGSYIFNCCYEDMKNQYGVLGNSDIRVIENTYNASDLKACNDCMKK